MTLSIVSMLEASAFRHSFECFAFIEKVSFSTFFNTEKIQFKRISIPSKNPGKIAWFSICLHVTIFTNKNGGRIPPTLCLAERPRSENLVFKTGENHPDWDFRGFLDMGVSKYRDTPKSSILIGFSIIFTIHFGVPLFLETPIYSFGRWSHLYNYCNYLLNHFDILIYYAFNWVESGKHPPTPRKKHQNILPFL